MGHRRPLERCTASYGDRYRDTDRYEAVLQDKSVVTRPQRQIRKGARVTEWDV